MIDNSEIVAKFVPEHDDEDTFIYTELLDRSKLKQGSNRVRLLRTFYHRSRVGFWEVMPAIRELCEKNGVRAYTRLAPRSMAKVGRLATTLMVEAALVGHWKDMAYIYARACGRVTPNTKLWLIDVDNVEAWADWHNEEKFPLEFVASIPSKKGLHVIVKPFNIPTLFGAMPPARLLGLDVHKDNPTNLYIPESSQ